MGNWGGGGKGEREGSLKGLGKRGCMGRERGREGIGGEGRSGGGGENVGKKLVVVAIKSNSE